MPRTESPRRPRWMLPVALVLLLFAAVWSAQGPLLRVLARAALPAMARANGRELDFDVLDARFFRPIVLGNVHLHDAAGSDVRATRVELAFASLPELLRRPRCMIRSLIVRELSGGLHLGWPGPSPSAAPTAEAKFFRAAMAWPPVVEITATKFFLSQGDRHLLCKDASLSLSEESTGRLQIGEAGLWAGSWSKILGALRGATAWRDGTAYFSDVAAGEDIIIDSLAVGLGGPSSLALRARAFGGSLSADWSAEPRTTAAVNAFDLSLDAVGRFLALQPALRGRLGTLKFTFSGDPHAPYDAQSSLRVEAADFSYDKRSFATLRGGASMSGRQLKIDQCELEQKGNRVSVRGSLQLPATRADWRTSDVSLETDATVGDLQVLSDLFGRPWSKISGGLTLGARVGGRLGEPAGWIKARGWDLRAPGVPVSSLQADLVMQGGAVTVSGLESHSGPNFLRAGGEVSLREPLSYRGRLEARVREMSRYLEPLGRFAPDWARQGGLILFWDGDGSGKSHSGVVSLELFDFTGELNPVPINGKFAATYSPGNVYVSRFLLDRGPLSLSASCYLSGKGLSMQDIQLFNLRQRLLRGELFLPVSFPLLLEGKTWSQTMLPGGQVYAAVRSDDLRLGPLANLFGQPAPFEGRVDWKLDASGPWENPSAESVLAIEGFRAAFDSLAIPGSRVSGRAVLAAQRLDVAGEWDSKASAPLKFTASIPLLGRNESGGWRILDRDKPVSAKLDVPALDLKNFAGNKPLAGEFSGSAALSGQLSAPRLDGAFSWGKVTAVPVDGLAPVTDFSGKLVLAGSAAKFEETRGQMGGGNFTLEGGADFADPAQFSASAKISGTKLALVDTDQLRLHADVDLSVVKSVGKRSVTGDITFMDSDARVMVSAMPLLLSAGTETKPSSIDPPFRVGGWLGEWDADIRVHSGQPVLLADGAKCQVELRLSGPLRTTVPVGLVELSGWRVALPSGPLDFARAAMHFTREMPWTPILDLCGKTQARGYEVQAIAWGPLGGQQLKLSSIPELSSEQIVLLLGAGLSPEIDRRAAQFPAAGANPAPPELPPSRIGYRWEVR